MQYLKNELPRGSPANWNAAIALAKGDWIKIMHHDDWFATPNALAQFAEAATSSKSKFIFSGFHWHNGESILRTHMLSKHQKKLLSRMPLLLFKENIVGNPSTTLIQNEGLLHYDENLKWVVDFEFYMRAITAYGFFTIAEPLVNIGIGSHQITAKVFRNPTVEVPENIYLLQKMGTGILCNIYVYDYYWRFLRNLKMRSLSQLQQFTGNAAIPPQLQQMLKFESSIPFWLLNFGPVSKLLMAGHFLATTYKRGASKRLR